MNKCWNDNEGTENLICARNSGQGYWQEDDKAGALGTEARGSHESNLIAFNWQSGQGINPQENLGNTHIVNQVQVIAYGGNRTSGPIDQAASLMSHGSGRYNPYEETFVVGPIACNSGPKSHGAGNFHCNQAVDAGHILAFSAGQSEKAGSLGIREEQAPTLKGSPSGSNMVPTIANHMLVRRLTPTECERLQGFPDGWTAGLSDSARYRCLGNAVAVPVIRWIGQRIKEVSNL